MSITEERREIIPAVRRHGLDLAALAPLLLLIGLLAVLYVRALDWWWYEWTAQSTYYQHGVFIPFFVGIMIWRDRERLRRLPLHRSLWGLALVLPAIAMVFHAYRASVTLTLSISYIMFLVGATLLLTGPQITRALLFPMLFLFTMIPLVPNMIINQVAFPIQVTSAKLAATILNLIGFHTDRVGVDLIMENYKLNVELPCSGFKTLIGLLAFSGAFAYLVEGSKRKRWILFLVSAPLAVLVNGVRIALIGIVGEVFSGDAAHVFHDYSGFIVLICGFLFLFNLARYLGCERFLGISLQDTPAPKSGAEGVGGEPPLSIAERDKLAAAEEVRRLDAELGPPRSGSFRFISAGIYPIIGLVALACLGVRLMQPARITYPLLLQSDLGRSIGGGAWSQVGENIPIDKVVEETLNPKFWMQREYSAALPRVASMDLLISGGNSRRVFHDPHECFLGSGYLLHDVGVTTIDTPTGPLRVQETIAENVKERTKSLMMFVYVVEGQQIQSAARVHATMMYQTLFGESGKPSYFLRFRQLQSGTDKERRDDLISFVRAVWAEVGPKVSDMRPTRRVAAR